MRLSTFVAHERRGADSAENAEGMRVSYTVSRCHTGAFDVSTLAPSNAPLFSSSILAPQKGITRNQGLSFYFQYLGYSDNTLLSPEAEVHCVIRILY